MSWVRTSLVLLLVMTSGWRCGTQRVPSASDQAARRADAPAATTVVGPAGGTLSLPDGAQVVVPNGALQAPTTISLREVPLPPTAQIPPGTLRVGKVYTIEPRVTGSQPMTVTLPYDPKLLPAGYQEGSISIYQLLADGRLSMVGSVTADPMPESSGQNLDVDNNLVTIRVPMTATYTLLAIKD